MMLSLYCAACGSKKLRFIKEQGASGLLSNLGIKTPILNSHIKWCFCFKDTKSMK